MTEKVYRKIISDEDPWQNQYILEGEGKSSYDPERKVFTPAYLGSEFDIVYLNKRSEGRRFVEFKSVFEKEYKKI